MSPTPLAADGEFAEIIARYPRARSAVLPLLHLVQSRAGRIGPDEVAEVAAALDLTPAEVTGVVSFYTMYSERALGRHHIGVCTNTLCAMLGGDALFERLTDDLGVANKGTTGDGMFTVERIECQAACTHAPVVTIDWEFFDDMTPTKLAEVVAALRAGQQVTATRGGPIRGIRHTERVLAGFDDDPTPGSMADDRALAGVRVAQQRGMTAPVGPTPTTGVQR
ncbi:MAG: NAD(P)H-dependent oxidoreductase subunit E [Actinomycetales bacterium]|nr:NAD(P)H-dependent oxidoreductase subunit E [Actinomycetales bacterium]